MMHVTGGPGHPNGSQKVPFTKLSRPCTDQLTGGWDKENLQPGQQTGANLRPVLAIMVVEVCFGEPFTLRRGTDSLLIQTDMVQVLLEHCLRVISPTLATAQRRGGRCCIPHQANVV